MPAPAAIVPGPRAYDGTTTMRDIPGLSHRQQSAAPMAAYRHLLYPARTAAEGLPPMGQPSDR